MNTFHITSLADIPAVAKAFRNEMGDRTIYAFYGKMGVGKTTFIKELCAELGSDDVVNSPTFAIVNEYDCAPTDFRPEPTTIYHFDFYRIKKLEEAYDMGYDEYFYSGKLCFIEWPELIEEILPEDAVRVTIVENEDGTRTMTMA